MITLARACRISAHVLQFGLQDAQVATTSCELVFWAEGQLLYPQQHDWFSFTKLVSAGKGELCAFQRIQTKQISEMWRERAHQSSVSKANGKVARKRLRSDLEEDVVIGDVGDKKL